MTSEPTTASSAETQASLLSTAEKMFAERGIATASLRAITQAAGVNLAAVHYHFGSKEGLVRAVFARRLGPLNRERIDRLDACESEAGDRPVELRCVLAAFVAPVIEMLHSEEGIPAFARLVGRSFAEPQEEEGRALLMEQFREVMERFMAALKAALPDLSAAELHWRFHFMIGSMAHIAACGDFLDSVTDGLCRSGDTEQTVHQMLAFLEGAMNAPPAGAIEGSP